jgi:hypothetical protein
LSLSVIGSILGFARLKDKKWENWIYFPVVGIKQSCCGKKYTPVGNFGIEWCRGKAVMVFVCHILIGIGTAEGPGSRKARNTMASKRKRAQAPVVEPEPEPVATESEEEEPEEEVEVENRFYGGEGDSDDSDGDMGGNDDEDDDVAEGLQQSSSSSSGYGNRQRVLLLSSRGITARYRHLLEDLKKMIPHHKKDSKLDCKGDIQVVNEIAEMKSCNQIVYLDTRKHQDLYMFMGHSPHGPTAKFHVVNVHNMDELKLTGNCMLGSRPLLNFDIKFESAPHWKLIKSLLTDVFNTPKGHPKSKPFVDHIISFFIVKANICKFVVVLRMFAAVL